jgi:hypothetical protein
MWQNRTFGENTVLVSVPESGVGPEEKDQQDIKGYYTEPEGRLF